ncbi:MAG: cupredoxin domain-containing protein [Candidatus Methylomirabilales bacterium]
MNAHRVVRVAAFVLLISGVALSQPGAWAATEVPVEAREYEFNPNPIHIRQAGAVTFIVTNKGDEAHGFKIDGVPGGVNKIAPGKTARVTFTLSKGRYTFYCPVDGHRDGGMEGSLSVVTPLKPKPAPKPRPPARSRPGYY